MTAVLIGDDNLYNPLDVAELVVMDRDWAFDRLDDGELVAEARGMWCNYRLWFSWQEDMGGLTVGCAFDAKLPKASLPKIYALLALVNERLWIGHFTIGSEDQTVMFRHTLMLRDGSTVSSEQMQELLDIALQECERFYPAFQAVVWGGKPPAEALQIAIFDTIAEA